MNELKTQDFDFELPENLIASRPTERRDTSRMLVVNRQEGTISHQQFKDLKKFTNQDDLFVFNDTKVVRARYFSDDGKCEIVRVNKESPLLWRCMVRPGKRLKVGRSVIVGGISGNVVEIDDEGYRLIHWEREIDEEQHGTLALPHYMQREAESVDFQRYQTVYAREEGAIAAPTAGLHFTPELVQELNHTFLTLHVGVGTFRPVKAEIVKEHEMHSETYSLSQESAEKIRSEPRVISVGTTVMRVLEHLGGTTGVEAGAGKTNIFIYPPYQPIVTDALITNFHLPKSSLLMLVSAFAGQELIQEAYHAAIQEEYRFYSYGDCMLIL